MNNAKNKPILLPLSCWILGSLLVIIDINIMLSTPSTISKMVRVKRLSHASGDVKNSIIVCY
jgi:hypothetical protein